jgi:Flp pilus assembly protein TadD
MRHLFCLFLACLVGALQPLSAQSDSDPGDLFVNAYMAAQEAEKAEQAGDFRLALNKFRYAKEALESVASKSPGWQPAIVNYRKQRVLEGIARVQGKGGKPAAKPGGGRVEKNPVEPPLPGTEVFPELPEIQPVQPQVPDTAHGEKAAKRPVSPPPVKEAGEDIEESIRKMKERQAALQAEVKEANAATQRAEQEKKDIARRLAAASEARATAEEKQKVLQDRADRAEKALLTAQGDGEKVRGLQMEASEARRLLRAAKLNDEVDRDLRRQFEDRLKAAQVKYDAMVRRSRELEMASKDAPGRVRELEQQLAKVQAENTELKGKLTTVTEQLTTLRESAKNVDKLVSDNAALTAKLADAQKQIANFKAEGEEKDKLIASLKQEVVSVKEQLAKARSESANFQKQMGEMQARLETQGRELAQVKTDQGKLKEENLILRGIVLRQQKQEAQRAATKKLVLGELAKLEVNSKTLLKQIDFLGQPVVTLTAKEKSLFKKGNIDIPNEEISAPIAVTDPPPGTEPEIPKDPAVMEKKPEIAGTVPPPPTGTEPPPATEPVGDLAKLVPPTPTTPPPPKTDELPTSDPVDKGTLPNSTPGQPNIPSEFLPAAKDGKDLFEKGDYRGAEKVYEKILAKVPNNLYILSNLGVVRFRAGKLKQAEEVLVKATKIAPEDGFSHCTLGIVYYTAQKLDEAVSSLTKALAINPKNATAHNYLGITAASKGWQESALKELETACTLDPGYADAHFNLAVVFATQTPPNKEKAQQYYKRATELGAEPDGSLENMLK